MRSFLVFCGAFLPLLVTGASVAGDPCAKIAGKPFAPTTDVRACLKSFPFNETLRQNVLTNVARVFDFFTFEDYYLNSPPPFQESTINIRARLNQINHTKYETDYDFNIDLYDFTTQLNDGHTRWFPNCYTMFQNTLPAPLVNIEMGGVQGVFIAPDSIAFLSQLGPEFSDYFAGIGFNWQRLAGARVIEIEGMAPYEYADFVAKTVSGNYLDHGVRVNSVFSSYRLAGTDFSQRIGDGAGPVNVKQTSLRVKLIVSGSKKVETIDIPFISGYFGDPFTDRDSYWATNCAANDATNGVDLKTLKVQLPRRRPIGAIIDRTAAKGFNLPPQFLPNTTAVPGSEGVIKSFILPDNKTGVMFVGSFTGDFNGFQSDVVQAVDAFKKANVAQVLIDLTNNGGGFVCLGQFLHRYLSGSKIGDPGFVTTHRANPLAQKVLAADIALGLTSQVSIYAADNYAFLNGTQMPASFNYFKPSLPAFVNGRAEPTSQRMLDTCELTFTQPIPPNPPFDLRKVAIVSNGNCASTCAQFSTVMFERHHTKIAIFGGKPGERLEYKGMAGNEVLEWTDIDTEIKTAGLKDDPLAPPDLLVSGNMRHNYRTAYSFLDKNTPIAYKSELPTLQFSYTAENYNNPQALWTFAAKKLFG